MSFKSTQQKGNIVKGKLKSQKELKKITSSDEYKKAGYQEKNKMLNVATHKRGALVGGQKKLDKNNNNRIDAQDFKILKAEKAKGRGQGLQDEKMKPGKVKPVKAVLGLAAMGLMGAKMLKGKKKAMAVPGVGAAAAIAKKKKEILGKRKGDFIKRRMMLAGKSDGDTSFDAKKRAQDMGVIDKKTGKGRDKFMKAAKSVKLGKKLLLPVAAGVAASQYLRSKLKKKEDKNKLNKKMGGGMMQRPGYNVGGSVTVKTKLGRNKPTKMY
jgi:hypothetical protein